MTGRNEVIGWGWAPKHYGANIYVKYRLSLNDIHEMFDRQGGECPGCRRDLAHPLVKEMRTGLKPQIDHLHKYTPDGEPIQCEREDVRGLLCGDCNYWAGQMRDNAERILQLGGYLASPQPLAKP